MPAIVNIKSTKNLTKAVNYASGYNGKAKAHNGYNMPRVLCQSGVNCTPKNGLKRMMDRVKRKQFLQDLKPKPRKIVQAYTLIQSFDASFDYKNIDDVKKVNQLGQKLVGQVVPDKMALVFTQADGTHHMLHNHIIVCSLSENLKAMSGKQTNFRTWAKANDEVLKAEGLETLAPVGKTTTAKEKLTRAEIAEMDKLSKNKDANGNPKPKQTRMEEIKERIEQIEQDPNVIDFDSFVEVAKKHDLDVHVRRNKKGLINGLSYKLLNTDMKRGIRARRLGANYMKESLNDVFQSNLERKRLAKQREARIEAGGSSATAETAETRQLSSTDIEFVEQSSDLRKEAQNRELLDGPSDNLLTVILDEDSRNSLNQIQTLLEKQNSTFSSLRDDLATMNENIENLMNALDSSLLTDKNSTKSEQNSLSSNNKQTPSLFSLVLSLTESLQKQQDINKQILNALKLNDKLM